MNERYLIRAAHTIVGDAYEQRLLALDVQRDPDIARLLWRAALRHRTASLELLERERRTPAPWARAGLVRCLLLAGRVADAREVLAPLGAETSSNVHTLLLAECAVVEGRFAEAERLRSLLVVEMPSWEEKRLRLDRLTLAALLHERLGRRGDSAAAFEAAEREEKIRSPFLSWRSTAATREALAGSDPRRILWEVLGKGLEVEPDGRTR